MSGTAPRLNSSDSHEKPFPSAKGPQEVKNSIPSWLQTQKPAPPAPPAKRPARPKLRTGPKPGTKYNKRKLPQSTVLPAPEPAPDRLRRGSPLALKVRDREGFCSPAEFLSDFPTYWDEHSSYFTEYLQKLQLEKGKVPHEYDCPILPETPLQSTEKDPDIDSPSTPKRRKVPETAEVVHLRSRRARKIKKTRRDGQARSPTQSPVAQQEDPAAKRLRLSRISRSRQPQESSSDSDPP